MRLTYHQEQAIMRAVEKTGVDRGTWIEFLKNGGKGDEEERIEGANRNAEERRSNAGGAERIPAAANDD
jgi:hypothetical protein